MRLFLCLILIFPCLIPGTVCAVDDNNLYAVDGIGALACQKYVEAKDRKLSSYLQFGGWIEGYFTASNKFLANTYDLSSWQTTETLATILYTECSKNPKASFVSVVDQLTYQLQHFSLKEKSTIITARYGKFTTKLPQKTLLDAQKKLVSLGYLHEEPNGKYNKNTAAALMTYQKQKNIPKTGLPDQYTLWNLLLP